MTSQHTDPASTAATPDRPGPDRPARSGIDPRGPRAGAAVTSVLLAAVVLAGPSAPGVALLGLAVTLFATGVALGPARSPLGVAYRRLLAPRLRPTAEREDPRPPRFAQAVGLALTGVGLALTLAGVPAALLWTAGAALVAALLNATIGLCLGCELYLLVVRFRARLGAS